MNKNNKLLLVAVIIGVLIIVLILINLVMLGGNDAKLVQEGETLETENFDIEVNDVYNADFFFDETINNFDQYVAVDLSITNNDDLVKGENKTVGTLMNFRMQDTPTVKDVTETHMPTIDENYKKYSATLAPGETFDVTLVFAVDYSDEYILYYNETIKEEDSLKQGIVLDGKNLETKKVENTVEHKLERRESENTVVTEEEIETNTETNTTNDIESEITEQEEDNE